MNKADIYGVVSSVLSVILVFLILWLVVIPTQSQPQEEGIMVSFGDADDGGGSMPEAQPEPQPTAPTPPPRPTTKPVVTENVMTQDKSALALAEQKKKEQKEREQAEKLQKEEERKQAEKKRQEQEAVDKANNLMGSLGNSGAGSGSGGTGSGTTTGNTNQGNPLGSGAQGGNTWSLNGRNINGTLVRPTYSENVEGKITVAIRVDANGNVISASIGSPTNISNTDLRNAAIKAAKATRFTTGNGDAVGLITYNFKLN